VLLVWRGVPTLAISDYRRNFREEKGRGLSNSLIGRGKRRSARACSSSSGGCSWISGLRVTVHRTRRSGGVSGFLPLDSTYFHRESTSPPVRTKLNKPEKTAADKTDQNPSVSCVSRRSLGRVAPGNRPSAGSFLEMFSAWVTLLVFSMIRGCHRTLMGWPNGLNLKEDGPAGSVCPFLAMA